MNKHNRFAKAAKELCFRNVFVSEYTKFRIALLIREEDWRPLDAPWWREKQVYVIGVDIEGNFLFLHPSGSVLHWRHKSQSAQVLAKSIDDFAGHIIEENYAK